ncbi:hypothetical protein TA3x_005193 [Tundrisphaera sp. TA3]|uniref:hypothetical protein n=1 Tax=Tundrisphaera sp. TA3 TaxID=3435775 RepID=UPI003EBC3C60
MEPTSFAQAIRDLARDAHRALSLPSSPATLWHLARRADCLGSSLGDRRSGPPGAWLDSLGRRLRTAALERAGAARQFCSRA